MRDNRGTLPFNSALPNASRRAPSLCLDKPPACEDHMASADAQSCCPKHNMSVEPVAHRLQCLRRQHGLPINLERTTGCGFEHMHRTTQHGTTACSRGRSNVLTLMRHASLACAVRLCACAPRMLPANFAGRRAPARLCACELHAAHAAGASRRAARARTRARSTRIRPPSPPGASRQRAAAGHPVAWPSLCAPRLQRYARSAHRWPYGFAPKPCPDHGGPDPSRLTSTCC